MSDTFLRLIPTQPSFVPSNQAAEAAANRLRELIPEAERIDVARFEQIQFVDQGGNFERLICPHCKADLTEHSSEWMDTAAQTQFEMRKVLLLCCGREADLNDLDWESPAGFASFMLEVMNPELSGWLREPAGR